MAQTPKPGPAAGKPAKPAPAAKAAKPASSAKAAKPAPAAKAARPGSGQGRAPAPMRLALWVAGGVFVVDQALKFLVVHMMNLDRRLAIDVWPPFLNLRMAWNQGVNFGLFSGESGITRWLLITLAVVISAWVWIWVRRQPRDARTQVAAGLLVGGAAGNVVDRLVYGAVADFLNMSCCGFQNPWAFNVADIAIFAGAIGLVLFAGRETPAARPPGRGN